MLRIARTPGGLTMSALAGQIALTTGGVTRLLDRMIAGGLVERVPCRPHRRISFAGPADVGRRTLDDAVAVHVRHLESDFADSGDEDFAVLDELLSRLLRRVQPGPPG